MHERDQAIFVASDIEHMQIANLIYRTKSTFQFRKIGTPDAFHDLAPSLQRLTSISMFSREFQQPAIGDNSHYTHNIAVCNISQFLLPYPTNPAQPDASEVLQRSERPSGAEWASGGLACGRRTAAERPSE